MSRFSVASAVYVLTVLNNMVLGGGAQTNEVLRVSLDISDGSRVIGIPAITSVCVQTAFAKVDIPLRQLSRLMISPDHATASVELTNGDKMTGVLNLDHLDLSTTFGTVCVATTHICALQVSSNDDFGVPAKLRDSLTLHYSFDMDSGGRITDRSGKGHDGQVRGATWVPKGKSGGAFEFNGSSDYIETTMTTGLGASFTVALWFDQDAYLSGARDLFDAHVASYGNYWAYLACDGDQKCLVGYLYDGSSNPGTGSSPNSVALKKWHHAALVRNTTDSTISVYLDGVRVDSTRDTVQHVPSYGTLVFGGYSIAYPNRSFKGRLDDIMIFASALSDEDVKTLYQVK